MKILLTAYLLVSFAILVAGEKKIEGWIFPLSEIPINVVPWHPMGEFLVIHEREFLDSSKPDLADVEPIHTWVTVDE